MNQIGGRGVGREGGGRVRGEEGGDRGTIRDDRGEKKVIDDYRKY